MIYLIELLRNQTDQVYKMKSREEIYEAINYHIRIKQLIKSGVINCISFSGKKKLSVTSYNFHYL